jgi:Kef-type K+ transport system membrane component KefB
MIAVVGSVLPIGIATSLALALNGTDDVKAAIAAGASFAPTSLGIALNILRAGGILNTPVGQLIISAAVIDDMIALIILSQLESLSGTIDAASILIPIVSAFCFLIIGGYVSLFIIPPLLKAYVLPRFDDAEHGRVEMIVMFGFLLGMMPATYYAKASYLMGAFVTGLAFCTSHELHVTFVRQFKRILPWLMRIFFAASIGFQVPIKDFADGVVIYQGLLFVLALLGKLTVSHPLASICFFHYKHPHAGRSLFPLGRLYGAQFHSKSLFYGSAPQRLSHYWL